MLVEPSPAATGGALHAQQRVGLAAQPFLTDRAEAKRAYALAEQLGSVNAATQLGTTWLSLRKAFTRHGLGMPPPTPKRSASGPSPQPAYRRIPERLKSRGH